MENTSNLKKKKKGKKINTRGNILFLKGYI